MIIAKRITGEQIKVAYPMIVDQIDNMQTASSNNRYPTTMRDGSEDQQIGPTEDDDGYYRHYEIIDRYEKVKLNYFHLLDTLTGEENIMNEEGFDAYQQEPAIIMETAQGIQPVTEDKAVRELLQVAEATGGVYHMIQDPQTGQPTMMPGEEGDNAIPNTTTRINVVTKLEMVEQEVVVMNRVIVDRIMRIMSVGVF